MVEKPDTLPEYLSPIWDEMLASVNAERIPAAAMEALCVQVHRARDASKRITDEGLIVRDEKSGHVPHPALKLEQSAQAEIAKWVKTYPPRRR